MIEYVIHEMPGLSNVDKSASFPKMVLKSNLSTEELVERIAFPGSGVSRASVVAVLMRLSEQLAASLADGHSVTIDGIGTFTAALGYKEGRVREDISDEHAPNLNARSIEISKVNFKVDSDLVKQMRALCTGVKRRGEMRVQKLQTTRQQRLAMVLDYLDRHEQISIKEYAALTSLRYHTAQLELKQLRDDLTSGIRAKGHGVTLVYVKG